MARLGVFGGSFDPPHLGHLILAEEAIPALDLEQVLWVLTPEPPHKQGQSLSPAPIRLEMVAQAIQGNPRFVLSRIDLDRPGPQYTVDTIEILRSKSPGHDWILLLGEDSLRDLPTWGRPRELIEKCALGVMRRPGIRWDERGLERELPGIGQRLQFFPAPGVDISSSDVRQRAHEGRPIRYLVPHGVWEIIERSGIYRDRP
ncbi:MAG: nicotinate-nucleotide adenylyltransferase [Anaerolineales bacterium]|jgi:nicotinate-nucleotide adenylyltransferase